MITSTSTLSLDQKIEPAPVDKGKSAVLAVANELSGTLSAWEKIGSFGWEYCHLLVDSYSLRIGISTGGVVSVNGDPFTPFSDGRRINSSLETILVSCRSPLQRLKEADSNQVRSIDKIISVQDWNEDSVARLNATCQARGYFESKKVDFFQIIAAYENLSAIRGGDPSLNKMIAEAFGFESIEDFDNHKASQNVCCPS